MRALRIYRPDACQPFEWAFRGHVPTYRTVKKDILSAGISPRDEYGRRFDLHAMRTTFGTLLSAAGVAPRVTMQLMRHSEMKLTMKTHMDTSHLRLAPAVAMLPSLSLPSMHALKHAQESVFSGQNESSTDPPCHFLAFAEDSVSVSNGSSSSTPDLSLGERKMVGLVRFELTTSCTPCKRATRLRYSPNFRKKGQEAGCPWRKQAVFLTIHHSAQTAKPVKTKSESLSPPKRGSLTPPNSTILREYRHEISAQKSAQRN